MRAFARPRNLIAVAAVVRAAARSWWQFGRGVPVTTSEARRGSAAEIVYATGAVEPERWAKVTTLIKGRVVERCRCEGRYVRAGQQLARLDDAEAQAVLQELRAREELTAREVERQTQLAASGIVPPQALERVTAELRQVQAQIAGQIQRLAHYRLLAPMDGMVLREDGEVGEIVDSNVILYHVGQPEPLLLIAEVNEEDIPRVEIGQSVLLRADAFADRQLSGSVRDITPAGDPVARTYRIRVSLPADTPLRIGMSVEANIVARERPDALLVPAAAIRDEAVLVIENGRAAVRAIAIGIRGTQMVEVVSGLDEGENVISPVPPDLAAGARVRAAGSAAP